MTDINGKKTRVAFIKFGGMCLGGSLLAKFSVSSDALLKPLWDAFSRTS